MPKQIDYLIVGQGIAGSILAYDLLQKGQTVHIIHKANKPNSSQVAAGIFNPITGMRFVKTWLADELYPYLYSFYENLEYELQATFFHPTKIYRPLDTVKDQNQIIELCDKPEIKNFGSFEPKPMALKSFELGKTGCFVSGMAGWVNVPLFLENFRQYYEKLNIISDEQFDHNLLNINNLPVIYKDFSCKKIIFCEGYYATQNPYFDWLPFNAVKGENLVITAPNFNFEKILMKGIFMVPQPNGNEHIGSNNQYQIGATYNWADKTWTPTDAAKTELLQKFEKLFGYRPKVLKHNAGIRPSTIDRRPFLGLHPKFDQIGIFNGFGTKAISLVPYFSKQFAEFLVNQTELIPDVNINRFSSLYLESKNN